MVQLLCVWVFTRSEFICPRFWFDFAQNPLLLMASTIVPSWLLTSLLLLTVVLNWLVAKLLFLTVVANLLLLRIALSLLA